MTALLSVRDLTVEYGQRRSLLSSRPAPIVAVSKVDVEVPAGGVIGILGESGAGKSTLAKAMAGLIAPSSGSVLYEGERLSFPRTREEARTIQMVPQDPGSSLNPALTVGFVLRELLQFHQLLPAELVHARCVQLMELVGLSSQRLSVKPRTLSGGERQRVALARALAVEPRVLIADEILSALDSSVSMGILHLLGELHQRLSVTIILIAHDLAMIEAICQEVLIMHRGQIVERGSVESVYSEPSHPYTRSLLAAARRYTLPTIVTAKEQ